jgi:hypothetical protein
MDTFFNLSTGLGFGILGLCANLFMCLILPAIAIGGTIFWIMMLVDVINRKFDNESDKTIWILVIALGHLIGAIVYYFAVKNKKQ